MHVPHASTSRSFGETAPQRIFSQNSSRQETACPPVPSARQRVVQTLVAQRSAALRCARQHLQRRQPGLRALSTATASAEQQVLSQADAPTDSASAERTEPPTDQRPAHAQSGNGQTSGSGAVNGSANGSASAAAADSAASADDRGASTSAAQARERPVEQPDGIANGATSAMSNEAIAVLGRDDQGNVEGHRAGARVAVLQATKSDTIEVEERDRSLAEYMTLPASQYSVLDAKRIERIDDDTFRCFVGGLNFLSFRVEPVLTVSVIVRERGPTVKLLETELEGSSMVRSINDRFTATMTNNVRWQDVTSCSTDDSSDSACGSKQIRSDTTIRVTLEVPAWLRFLSVGVVEKTGSKVMQRVLNTMVPRFLAQLRADYDLWAAGDESRKPVGTGQL